MDWNAMHDALARCTVELFDTYGIKLSTTNPRVPLRFDEVTLAVMAFATREHRGSLVLSLTAPLLIDSFPKQTQGEPDYLDWAGELANQLTGRLKTRLLAQGIAISLSTPTKLCGKGVHLAAGRAGTRLLETSLWYKDTPLGVRLAADEKIESAQGQFSIPAQAPGEFDAF